jgi:hypothetical protein
MKITNLWIVQNPECYSTLGDIFHEQPAETLHHWILGATSINIGLAVGRELGVAYYTEREEALADAVVRLGRQAGIDAADGDYRAGTRGEIEDVSAEPCPARGDDRGCEPGHADDPSPCIYCGEPVALETPVDIDDALELPADIAPKHRAAAVRAFVRAYNEQMRALLASEEA